MNMRIGRPFVSVIALVCLLVSGLLLPTASAQVGAKAGAQNKLDRQVSKTGSYEVDDRFDHWREKLGSSPRLEAIIEYYKSIKGLQDYTPSSVSPTEPRYLAKNSTAFEQVEQFPAPNPFNQIAYGTVVNIPGGDLVMAFKDWGVFPQFWDGPPTDPAKIYVTRSSDGGSTWTTPAIIAEGDFPLDFNFLKMTRLGSGRILLNDLTPFEPDHYFYSDDDGVTWTSAAITELYSPNWHGPINGNVWQTYYNENSRSVMYRTSANGTTWSAGKTIMVNPNDNRYAMSVSGVSSGEESPFFVATVERFDYDTGELTTLIMMSTDSGNTWTQSGILPDGGINLSVNSLLKSDDDTIWIVAQGGAPWSFDTSNPFDFSSDIFFLTSSDFGATWTDPIAFSQFHGEDYQADLAFTDAGTFVVFDSARPPIGGIYYGLANVSSDAGAPAAVIFWDFPFGGIEANTQVPVALAVSAVNGVSSVELVLLINGVESTLPLVGGSASCTNYGLDSDVCWTGTMGPFSPEDNVSVEMRVTDNSSQVTLIPFEDTYVRWSAEQTAGNVDVFIQNNGFLARIVWPSGGDNYMCCGGPWIGDAASRVVIDEYSWLPTSGFQPTSGPGRSDQDIVVSYNDRGSLGLNVVQRSFQWSSPSLRNAIVFEYEYTNTGAVGNLDELFAAVQLDADLVNNDLFWDDLVAFSSSDNVLYMHDSGIDCVLESVPCPAGYIGLAILRDASGSAGKQSAVAPHTATWNSFDTGQFNQMTSGINPALTSDTPVDPDDYVMILTAQPFSLPIGQSKTVTFAVIMGGSVTDLSNTVTLLSEAYDATVTGIETESASVPTTFKLEQNYPNPFNPTTSIRYDVSAMSEVSLVVYDMLGRRVATLVDGMVAAGSYTASFDARALPSGTYVYRLDTPQGAITRSMVLVK